MKKKTTSFDILIAGAVIIALLFFTSCGTNKGGYGCPKAKQGARHDKNLRF